MPVGVAVRPPSPSSEFFFPSGPLPEEDRPPENICSVVLRISYGPFRFYTGGDVYGLPEPGAPAWWDLETPIARAAFESAPDPKELLLVEGGHFGLLYHPSPLFDRVSAAQADFLARHLA